MVGRNVKEWNGTEKKTKNEEWEYKEEGSKEKHNYMS